MATQTVPQNNECELKSYYSYFEKSIGHFNYTIEFKDRANSQLMITGICKINDKENYWKYTLDEFDNVDDVHGKMNVNLIPVNIIYNKSYFVKPRDLYSILYSHHEGFLSTEKVVYQDKFKDEDESIIIEILLFKPYGTAYDKIPLILNPTKQKTHPKIMDDLIDFLKQRAHTCQHIIEGENYELKWCGKDKCSGKN